MREKDEEMRQVMREEKRRSRNKRGGGQDRRERRGGDGKAGKRWEESVRERKKVRDRGLVSTLHPSLCFKPCFAFHLMSS